VVDGYTVARITYTVLVETLNPAQSTINQYKISSILFYSFGLRIHSILFYELGVFMKWLQHDDNATNVIIITVVIINIICQLADLSDDHTPKPCCTSPAVLPSSRPTWMECESASAV